ncbi:MAG TPA: hypothetical protein VGG74_24590 [Kofleriaceae bacterium]
MTTPRRSIIVGGYTIDASIREVHTFESEVTQFPVEQGSPISDNVRPKPITVQLEGIVSDTPLPPIVQSREVEVVGSGPGDDDSPPSVDAIAALLAIRDAREPVPISTALKSYDNMALQNLEIPRDSTTGEALRFTATFVQIVIVTTTRASVRTTAVRTSRPGDSAAKNFGKYAVTSVLPNGIAVITLTTAQLAADTSNYLHFHYQDLYGPYILQDAVGQHFRVVDTTTTVPDGWIGQDNLYHAFDTNDEIGTLLAGAGSYTPAATSDPSTDAASYDPSTGQWVNQQGLPVVSQPPSNVDTFGFPGAPLK